MRHFAPTRFNRRSIRLKGYDYTGPGEYFVTINTHQFLDLFGRIVEGEMWLNEYGVIAKNEWLKTAELRPYIYLDEFVIMPNHVQGIIIIQERDRDFSMREGAPSSSCMDEASSSSCTGAARCARTGELQNLSAKKEGLPIMVRSESLGAIIRGYKSAVSKRINAFCNTPGAPVWHRNYHDRIIRGEREFKNVQRYIVENPRRWDEDQNRQDAFPRPTPR